MISFLKQFFKKLFKLPEPVLVQCFDATPYSFNMIEELNQLLFEMSKRTGKSVIRNRLYLLGDEVLINASVDGNKYVFVSGTNGYQVWHNCKKPLQLVKFKVTYEEILDGSFIEKFK